MSKDNFLFHYFGDGLFIDEILILENNIKIPNFFKNYCNNILPRPMMEFEIEHLIKKIFFNQQNNLTFYENKNFKISKNDIVFDCGGNMGLFAAAVANRCKHVYCFEPMSLIRKNLEKTASLYNNITIIPKGLWKENKILKFLQKDNPGASRAVKYDGINKTLYAEKCSLITLDSFIEETGIIPNFIKVDIENSEIEFLEGAQECLKKYSPKISIALHSNNKDYINNIIILLKDYKISIKENPQDGLLLLGEKDENKFKK